MRLTRATPAGRPPATRAGLAIVALAALALVALASGAAAADNTWPRELRSEKGVFTFYQPQPETFEGNVLTARSAISWTSNSGDKGPIFGVAWYTCRVDTDRDMGTATLRNIVVIDVRWPESKKEEETRAASYLSSLLAQTEIPIALERLKASLATAQKEKASLEGLKNDPPKFLVVNEVAVLLQYDGEPKAFAIPNTDLEQFVNSAFAVVRDKKTGACYLSGGKTWYTAKDPKGPWTPIQAPPANVAKVVPPDTTSAPAPTKAPKVVVATEPSELISTDGAPQWQPIGKGDLLYVKNTESSVVREVATGKIYVLASGRWFQSTSLNGPWAFVKPDNLPKTFAGIPPESDLGDTRASVPGTDEANDAVLDAQVPQTAAINRNTAKLDVKYDGDPQFKQIQGTGVAYAVNTSAQVLRISGKYYACDDAVWFVSAKATGPWAIADSVPSAEIKKIPPSEPVYNTTYVTIYETTPSVVYVGYTPGYMWSYPYYGVPVYGTGWYYHPYWGPAVYYPRPCAWGFHVSYNPWYGWGFGFSYSAGFMSIGVSFGGGYGGYYRPGYWGGYYRPPYYPPGGYRPPYYGRPGHGGGYNRPGYRPPGYARPTPYGGRGQAAARPANTNLYQGAASRDRVAPSTMQRDASRTRADRVAKGPNNVYGDKQGNVYRQNSNGSWQSRENGAWKNPSGGASTRPSSPSTRPSTPPTRPSPSTPSTKPSTPSTRPSPSTREAPSGLSQDARARQQGAYRSGGSSSSRGGSSYSGNRGGSSGGASRSGGGRSGGGGGGRRR